MDIGNVLAQRATTHGNFNANAAFVKQLMATVRSTQNWDNLLPAQQEAIEMLVRKLARILMGSHMLVDSWRDCIGYLQLALDTTSNTPGALDVVCQKIVRNTENTWEVTGDE